MHFDNGLRAEVHTELEVNVGEFGPILGTCWVYVGALLCLFVKHVGAFVGRYSRSSWWYLGGLDRSLEPNGHKSRITMPSWHRNMSTGSLGKVDIRCGWCQHGINIMPQSLHIYVGSISQYDAHPSVIDVFSLVSTDLDGARVCWGRTPA